MTDPDEILEEITDVLEQDAANGSRQARTALDDATRIGVTYGLRAYRGHFSTHSDRRSTIRTPERGN